MVTGGHTGASSKADQAEKALIRSEALHRTTIDALIDALHVIDRNLVIVLVNEPFRQWCRVLGLSDALEGKSVREAFPFLGSDVEDQYRRVFKTGEPLISEEENTLNGERIITETRKVPVFEGGEVQRVITLVRDMTGPRSVQAQLHHAQKMDALGRLAGGIAHDFNNVLTTIIGCAELLKPGVSRLSEKDRDYLRMILQVAGSSADLVAKLLAFGKKAPRACEQISVNAVLKDSIALVEVSRGKGIRIAVAPGAERDSIRGDASALENALLNLAFNGIAAMPDGGTLTFLTRNVTLDARYCETRPCPLEEGLYVEMEVRDTGVGIPAEEQHRIFEPFYTTREDGNGLGLATVYSTVRELGGEILLASKPGAGTSFFLRLPVR